MLPFCTLPSQYYYWLLSYTLSGQELWTDSCTPSFLRSPLCAPLILCISASDIMIGAGWTTRQPASSTNASVYIPLVCPLLFWGFFIHGSEKYPFLFCSSLTSLTHFTSVQRGYAQDSDLSRDVMLSNQKALSASC